MKEWQKNIRKVTPYVPGEQPKKENMIKLNTNENPYPPSPRVEEMRGQIDNLRLYPDPTVGKLVGTLAEYHGLKPEQVFVGVGSDDVLAMAFMTFFNSDKPILFPDITYSFYDVWAELYRIPYEQLPLDDSFRIVKEDYYKANGGVIFPNPNAPTAICEPVSFVEDIVKHNPDSVVIVDEAYIDFGGESCLPLTKQYDNLLVVRTFSKSRSLAGLRIGYCMGSPELIQALNDVKQSFNSYTMNQAAIELGCASVGDEPYFREHIEKIIKTREWFCGEMQKLGFSFPESKANFIFATHETLKAKYIFEEAKKRDIYVRYFDKPRIDNYLRITIGTDEEMKKLLQFLKELVNS
ncbi:MAG: histidinol-phosphate transaminase [Lachnospiraceae bacterium]|nr:histidinol-phosphate transaminase [Lachnospiraceae bacterium]